jgi:tetratricopeptide (TPR) repeat protein
MTSLERLLGPIVCLVGGRKTCLLGSALLCLDLTLLLTPLGAQSLDEYRVQVARLISDYQWTDALQTAERGLESFAGDPRLEVAAGALMIRVGRIEQGREVIEQAFRRGISDQELLRVVADLKLYLGEVGSAVRLLREIVEREPSRAANQHRLAWALFMSGQDEEALIHANMAVSQQPRDASYRRLYALVLERAGQSERAYAELKAALRMAPEDSKLLLQLSEKEELAEKWGNALEYLEMAVAVDPENPLFHRKLARIYAKLGVREQEQENLQRAERLEEAFEAYIQALNLAGDARYERAMEILEPVVARDDLEFPTGATFLAYLYRKAGDRDRALSLYQKLLAGDPAKQEVREQSAWLLIGKGELEAALELVELSRAESANQYLWEGYRKVLESDWEGALSDFRKVAVEYPLHPELLRQISLCLNSMGRVEEALSLLEKAYNVRPRDPDIARVSRDIRFDHAVGLQNQGAWENSLSILERLHLEDEDRADYLFYLAYSKQNLNRFAEAVKDYKKGLAINPGSSWARINLAYCHYYLNRHDEAAAQWEYLVRSSDEPEYVYNLGLSRIRQWKLQEGWDLVRKAAAADYGPAKKLLEKAGL